MTIETVRTPSGFKNVDLTGAASRISAVIDYTASTYAFPGGSGPGATTTVGCFVGVAESSEPPTLTAASVEPGNYTFTSAVLVGSQDLGGVVRYAFDLTFTRVLAAGASSTSDFYPYITIDGRDIALNPQAIECPV